MATLIERREKQQRIKVGKTPIGRSGNYILSGIHSEDHLQEMIGIEGMLKIDKMLRSDTQCQKIYAAITNPIKSADWDIPPLSEDVKDIEAATLMKQIFMKNPHKPWGQQQHETLMAPFYGHSVFEMTFENISDDELGEYTNINLAYRKQNTLEEWHYDEATEELISIKQRQIGDVPVDVDIPAENLIIFYFQKLGIDSGFGLMRPLYGPYKRKKLYKEVQAIGMERSAIGSPMLGVPDDVKPDSEDYTNAESALADYTTGESSYIMFPKSWDLKIDNNNTFDPEKAQVVIKAEDEDSAGAVLATFLELGIKGNAGALALGKGLADFFLAGIQYIAEESVIGVYNRTLIPLAMKLNFSDKRKLPIMTVANISEKAGKALMDVITGYTKAGVITKDEQLEDHVRAVHDLPKKAEGTIEDNKKVKGGEDDEEDDDEENGEKPKQQIELAETGKKGIAKFIQDQGDKIAEIIRINLKVTKEKMVADIIRKYKQLADDKKLKALDGLVPGNKIQLKKQLKSALSSTASKALDEVIDEVGLRTSVKLKSSEHDLLRIKHLVGDCGSIKLSEFSRLPEHVRLLLAKQAEIMGERLVSEMDDRVSFQFMSSERRTQDVRLIEQQMNEVADKYIESGSISTAGHNAAALMTNDTRAAYFFTPEVRNQIHSFTYINDDPKADICQYLADLTVAVTDEASLSYNPPLHHNCKTYLRSNLVGSRRAKKIDKDNAIRKAAPSEKALKSITLSEVYCGHH